MPKIKTHSGAKKRQMCIRHRLKRGLRKGGYADKTNEAAIKRMILYK